MKNDPEIYKKAKGFDKNPQNINKNGRPKKIYTIIKEKGYSKDDFVTAIGELFWHTFKELEAIHKDKTKPAIIQIIAGQLYEAYKKKDYNKIKELADHYAGKPLQKQEIDMNNGVKLNIEVENQEQKDNLENFIDEISK